MKNTVMKGNMIKTNNKQTFLSFMVLLLFTSTIMNAQMEPQYTQYMYNTSSVNPAYAGSREIFSLFGLYRNQWNGIDGAPVTANLSFNTPVTERMGLGLTIIHDEIGPSQETDIAVDFSYHIPINYKYQLYFGLKASGNLLNIDFTKLNIYNPGNPSFENNIDNQFSPNVGAGVYLQSEESYFGISVPYFLETEHYESNDNSIIRPDLSLYFMAGYVFDLSSSVRFKPAFLGTFVNDVPFKYDISANFIFIDKWTLGLSYRNNQVMSAMTGFQISNLLYLGYGYDFEVGDLVTNYDGTYEFFLRYEIFDSSKRKFSDRFF
jgi:type IX secretion system PorP/SprF family membrane protein